MTASSIAIVGAGGHAAVIIEAIRSQGVFTPVAIVDPAPECSDVLGVPVIGNDAELPRLKAEGVGLAVVAIGLNRLRQTLGESLLAQGFGLPPIIHPTALVSPSARIGEGVVVMARANIGARAMVCRLAVINTAAIVEHDDEIGVAAHVAPGVALGGWVRIGDRTLVGIGSAARPGVKVGSDVVIGAGSAVVCDLPDGAVVGGTPARPLSRTGGRP